MEFFGQSDWHTGMEEGLHAGPQESALQNLIEESRIFLCRIYNDSNVPESNCFVHHVFKVLAFHPLRAAEDQQTGGDFFWLLFLVRQEK